MSDFDGLIRWCILRTAGSRTIKLAQCLTEAGYEAWTPVETVVRRKSGSRATVEFDAAITPTFVFVHARHFHEMIALASQVAVGRPQFSLLRYAERYPLIADRDLGCLRTAEAEAAAKVAARRAREAEEGERRRLIAELKTEEARVSAARAAERERVGALRLAARRRIPAKTQVRVDQPAFTGMTGVVLGGDDREAVINFGGSLIVKVGTWLVHPTEL